MKNRLNDLEYIVVEAVSGDNLEAQIKEKKSILTNNEKGCVASHIKALEIFLQTDRDSCCILEDDVILGGDFYSLVDSYLPFPEDAYVLKLETMCRKVWIGKSPRLILNFCFKRLFTCHFGTAGYLTSRSGAKLIIEALSEFDLPADDTIFLKMLANKNNGKCFQMDPACCIQEFLVDHNNVSDILDDRKNRHNNTITYTENNQIYTKEKTYIRKFYREIKRLVRQLLFAFYRFTKIRHRNYYSIDFKK
jgi:GR25 family glycosyltransferase involved in LPS biosynthesis